MLLQEAADVATDTAMEEKTQDQGFDFDGMMTTFQENAIDWLINFVIAIAIYVIGKMVVKVIVNAVRKVMTRSGTDEILVNFLSSIMSGVLMLFVIIAAIKQLNIDTSSMVALVGAAGLAVGFAMQDSLNNFASGVMLIIFRPFKTGNFVEAGGATGTVEKINIFSTIMKTGDNREIIVPNGAIFGGTITNYSARSTRRVDMVFGIGYDDDLLLAKKTLMEIVAADDRILAEPACAVAINDLGDSCVNFKVRPWVNSADYWDVLSDITEKVKLTFDAKGISIPYPQMDVHVHGQDTKA
ncbi:MAG: small conductance mechanosensitive channel [Planctomycetota bacterium]|jgi:small conductance mechanosensitive channel